MSPSSSLTAALADFDQLPIPAGVVQLDGTILAVNQAGTRLLGRSADELVGHKTWTFAPGADYLWEEVMQTVRDQGEVRGDITIATPEGPRPIQYLFVLRHYESRPLLLLFGLEYDAAREAARAADEGSKQRLEALGLVAGGIAHDFNNQLVSVLAEASAAREDPDLGTAGREALRRIEAAAMRMAQLTRQLLAYAGRGRFVTEVIDPDELLREARPTLEGVVQPGVTLSIRTGAERVAVEADRALLLQVLVNLVANASEAHGDGEGRIEVESHTQPSGEGAPSWFLEVRDTGVGMDETTISRIWDPFFTTKADRHGLGLSAVVGIVRRLGGEIQVRSRPGAGATFEMRLPVVPGAKPSRKRVSSPTMKASSLAGMRALVADDEPSVRTTIRRLLERRGVSVVLAADGREAEERLREGDYTFVVFDVMMPHLTGYQLLPLARRAQPEARVLLMSGYSDVERGSGSGAETEPDAFLEKPFTAKAFDEVLDQLLVAPP